MTLELNLNGKTSPHQDGSVFAYDYELIVENSGITALYGRSGGGKTTLLRLISGLDKAKGSVRFDGEIWQGQDSFVLTEDRHIAYVFQESRLFNVLNVEENVLYGLGGKWRNIDSETKEIVKEVCENLGIRDWLNRYPTQLSGGQQQRVALARCLVCCPRLLLLDEPFSSLGEKDKPALLRFLAEFVARFKITCLFVSHSRFEIESIASNVILIESGRVVAHDKLLELVARLDLDLSHEENATSILQASLQSHDLEYSLSLLSLGAQNIWVNKMEANIGDKLTLRVMARDVFVSVKKPVESSVLNHLMGEIAQIEHTEGSRVLLLLLIEGQKLLARITRKSMVNLKLQSGQCIYIQFKSVGLGAISI